MRLPQRPHIGFAVAALCVLTGYPAFGKTDPNNPLAPEVQSSLQKATRDAHGGKPAKAVDAFHTAIQGATTIEQCVQIAKYTESYGTTLMSERRECLQKALSLCKTREEYVDLAGVARKYECFDVERMAMDSIVKSAPNLDELYSLAKRAHQMADRDIVHQTLTKAYANCNSVSDALRFAREAHLVGADDMSHMALKDLIDDENTTDGLMVLLNQIEPFGAKDPDRYLLKKSLDQSSKFEDYVAIADAARKFNEPDIRTLAIYRAKKKKILQQFDADKAKREAESQSNKVTPAADNKSGF